MPDTAPGPEAVQGSHREDLHLTLNSDGKSHPLENGMAVFTLVAGIVSIIAGFITNIDHTVGPWAHVVATYAGLAALAVGLPAQLMSATREERVIIVTGLIAAFVGGALGLAHGGFHF